MSFVQQRERRSNAGNRMRALLDKEADMEELFEMDESEDEAFSEIDEVVDTVDSDFDMDESEGEAEQEQLAEEEEKQIRIAERQNKRQHQFVQKSTRSAIPKPSTATTSRDGGKVAKQARPRKKQQQQQQQDTAQQQGSDIGSRQSLRTRTILNRMHVEEQIRESEVRRALLPKRIRPEIRQMTQEELLAEAAITEEENKASLEQWQQREAERQAKAKVKMKRGIQGPFIRYYSYIDGPTNRQLSLRRKLVMLTDDKDGNTIHMDITDPEVLEYHQQRDIEESGIATKNLITFFPDGAGDIHNKTAANEEDPTTLASKTNKLQHIKSDGLTDRELDRLDRIPQLASWADRSPRYVKPLPCPITGKEARYREPSTNTPYATASSYEYIRNCLDHKYIWSPSLGIYTCSEGDSQGADGVPDGWERMVLGKRPDEEDWVAPLPSWMANTTEAASSASASHSSEHPPTGKSTRKKNRQRT